MVKVITDPQELQSIFPVGSIFWTINWQDPEGPTDVLGPFRVLSFLDDDGRNGTKVFVRNPHGHRQTVYANLLTDQHHGVCATKDDAQVHLEQLQREYPSIMVIDHQRTFLPQEEDKPQG
jgi:hypothetical protein